MSMLWLNSSGDPDGHVLGVERLRAILVWTRGRGVVIASDECYVKLAWDVPEVPPILDEWMCNDGVASLLCLYLLFKQSDMAGYRAAFLTGDPVMIGPITEICRHVGFLMPRPVQAAMTWTLGDDTHVAEQRTVYARGYKRLLVVLDVIGLVNDPLSVAGLYIWVAAKRPVDGMIGSNHDGGSVIKAPTGWDIVQACAELGIVVALDDLYSEAGRGRVRISFTATGSVIDEAIRRLSRLPEALQRDWLRRASDRLAVIKGSLRYLLSLRQISDEELGLSQ